MWLFEFKRLARSSNNEWSLFIYQKELGGFEMGCPSKNRTWLDRRTWGELTRHRTNLIDRLIDCGSPTLKPNNELGVDSSLLQPYSNQSYWNHLSCFNVDMLFFKFRKISIKSRGRMLKFSESAQDFENSPSLTVSTNLTTRKINTW